MQGLGLGFRVLALSKALLASTGLLLRDLNEVTIIR